MKASHTPKPRTLDVRSYFDRGEEPLTKILATVDALRPKESLLLITPFLPSPLIERLHSEGFDALPQRRRDGAWLTRFTRQCLEAAVGRPARRRASSPRSPG
jgi:uncharacterized protein (DUF2249 family)